ncbi:MAG TPA: hypothetical protein PLL57_07180 [Flavobacteriales bacterium]|nr:hypothetical protein [Flavobacteriales bacterium]
MERHERYDPEDIESLLSERGFDELLPDERAFVLRHVNGRDEYERMRALLHYVRPDERQRGGIEPEERVRETVLAAFRAQQQPAWRIWLNSVSLWLAPKEAAAAWRPALAFASLALLIVAGVVVVRQYEGSRKDPALAELHVKDVKETPTPPTPQPEHEAAEAPNEDLSAVGRDTNAGSRTKNLSTLTAQAAASEQPASEAKFLEQNETMIVREEAMMDMAAEAEKVPQPTAPPAMTDSYLYDTSSGSHLVTADELTRNMSTTNATGAVAVESVSKAAKTKQRAKADAPASRSMAEMPGILDLVASGW